jgi:hypothetical protein
MRVYVQRFFVQDGHVIQAAERAPNPARFEPGSSENSTLGQVIVAGGETLAGNQ